MLVCFFFSFDPISNQGSHIAFDYFVSLVSSLNHLTTFLCSSWHWILWRIQLSWRMSHILSSSIFSILDYIQVRHLWHEHQIDVLRSIITLHYIRRQSMTNHPTISYGKHGHLVKGLIIRSLHCGSIATVFFSLTILNFLKRLFIFIALLHSEKNWNRNFPYTQ